MYDRNNGMGRKRQRRMAQSRRLMGGRRLYGGRRLQAPNGQAPNGQMQQQFLDQSRGGMNMAGSYYGATQNPGIANLRSDCFIRGDYGAVAGLSQAPPATDFVAANVGTVAATGTFTLATGLTDADNANFAGKGITNLALTLSVDGVFPDGFDAQSLRQRAIDAGFFRVVKGTGLNTTTVATFPAIAMIISLGNDRYGVDVPIKLLEGLWSIIGFSFNAVGLPVSPDPAGYFVRPSLLITYGALPDPQMNSCGYNVC